MDSRVCGQSLPSWSLAETWVHMRSTRWRVLGTDPWCTPCTEWITQCVVAIPPCALNRLLRNRPSNLDAGRTQAFLLILLLTLTPLKHDPQLDFHTYVCNFCYVLTWTFQVKQLDVCFLRFTVLQELQLSLPTNCHTYQQLTCKLDNGMQSVKTKMWRR